MMQHAGADDLIETRLEFADPLDGKLAGPGDCSVGICRLSSSVQRTLVALKSMPVTLAAGQRMACLAACEVPQPATRME